MFFFVFFFIHFRVIEVKKIKETKNNEGEDEGEEGGMSAYYHFNSIGKKYYNKWDHFDVEAEEKKIDLEDQNQEKLRVQKGNFRKALREIQADLMKTLDYIDNNITHSKDAKDKGSKSERKEAISELENLNDLFDHYTTLLNKASS